MKMTYNGKEIEIADYRVERALRNGYKMVTDTPVIIEDVEEDHDQDLEKGED